MKTPQLQCLTTIRATLALTGFIVITFGVMGVEARMHLSPAVDTKGTIELASSPRSKSFRRALARPALTEKGRVKWFNDAKGFGFITRDRGGEAYVHHTAIITKGFASLMEGQRVSFEITEGPKGPIARDVVAIAN